MKAFAFAGRTSPVREILCVGAHSDDIEIGCGGTVSQLVSADPRLRVTWAVFSAKGERETEARKGVKWFLKNHREANVVIKQFRDGFFPVQTEPIKETFEQLKKQINPDIVFTHFRADRHQDHRVLSDLAWNTFRNHVILEYEIPKYDGDLGAPNVFVPLSVSAARRKARGLCQVFATQGNRHWFTEDLFLGLMRVRGIECSSPSGFAEAFYGRKVVLTCSLPDRR